MRISLPLLVLATSLLSGADVSANQSDPAQEDRKRMDRDIEQVDAYLAKWDRFANGEKSLVPELNRDGPAAIAALGSALKANDKRAPARLVFLTVVQVGGGIPVDSELGKSASRLLGASFPSVKAKKGPVYFAGDLYFWWLDHKKEYEAYPLFDEWSKREFARTTVIPTYERMRAAEKKKQAQ
jgi:hypothetical protein